MMKTITFVANLGLIFAALSQSSHYQLNNYSVGSGSTNTSASPNYKLQGSTGELSGDPSSSSLYKTKSGSVQAEQANVPGAPTLSNGGGTYTNKLNFIISTGNNPSDATFSVAVSTSSSFTTTNYVQADGTLGASPVYQTYAQWGSTTGTLAIGLAANTTYWFKVNASQGRFTNSAYGPSAAASTAGGPTLSFSLSPTSVSLGNLLPDTITSSPSDLTFTIDTNAANGGSIYMAGQYTGLHSTATNYTLTIAPSASANIATVSEGFGFQAGVVSAPLTALAPYNGTRSNVGAIYTTFQPVFSASSAISNNTATANVFAKASATTPSANDYQVILTFIAAASF